MAPKDINKAYPPSPVDTGLLRDQLMAEEIRENTFFGSSGDLARIEGAFVAAALNREAEMGGRYGPPKSAETIYNSYSGTDIVATILVPNEPKILDLGELQTISYSIHRENTPVRTLGHVNVCGFVKGPRTIAGSLIFTQFNEYAFYRLQTFRDKLKKNLFPLADMLPPFDVILTFSNELGMVSKMKIMGVTIVDEGATMSVDDLQTEQTYSYMARGIQPLTNTTVGTFAQQVYESLDPNIRSRGNVITQL